MNRHRGAVAALIALAAATLTGCSGTSNAGPAPVTKTVTAAPTTTLSDADLADQGDYPGWTYTVPSEAGHGQAVTDYLAFLKREGVDTGDRQFFTDLATHLCQRLDEGWPEQKVVSTLADGGFDAHDIPVIYDAATMYYCPNYF